MANVTIPELSALASPSPSDLVPVADVSTANDEVKKTSVGEIVGIITGDVEVAADGTATISELPVSKLQDGEARQLLQTAANGTDVEWTNDVYLPGTLDVSGNGTIGGDLTVVGDLTVENKNIELGAVTPSTDTTANGGGITLKGDTDKTFNWIDATNSWTSSEHIDLASGKAYYIGGAETLSATALGSAVVSSSLTSVGTLGTGAWEASTITPAYGGTGQTTYADGELLIGTTAGGLAKATLTPGNGIDITNADGSITIAIDNTVVTTSDTGSVTSAMLVNGTIVNEDINTSAAIAGTKIDPDFGSQFIETTDRVRASSGILFGNDTDPANALDDYEEGTWEPTFAGSSTPGTPTYNTNGRAGKYTKVGNKVTAWAYLDVTALGGAAGNINITGLPFNINNLGFGASGISVGHADGTLGNGVRAYHGTDLLELRNNNAAVAAATGQIYVFITYRS